MTNLTPRKPKFRRVWRALGCVLGVLLLVGSVGLYRVYRVANQIYQPAPQTQDSKAFQQKKPQAAAVSQDERRKVEIIKREEEQSESVKRAREMPKQSAGLFSTWMSNRLTNTEVPIGQTFLLVGIDSRKGEAARSDTIMLVTLPPSGSNLYLMSIPRDTYAHVPGHGLTKLNHAMSYGGVSLMKRSVESLLNIKIDHTVAIDFEGFRQVVDQLGGLDLVVEKNMRYSDSTDGTNIHLKRGQLLSTGKLALDYARFRADAMADTGRMQRQQRVIRAMIQKGSQPSSWPTLLQTLDILGGHVKTDVAPRDWVTLVMRYSNLRGDGIQTLSLQGENRISDTDHLWYFYVDEVELKKMGVHLQALKRGNA